MRSISALLLAACVSYVVSGLSRTNVVSGLSRSAHAQTTPPVATPPAAAVQPNDYGDGKN